VFWREFFLFPPKKQDVRWTDGRCVVRTDRTGAATTTQQRQTKTEQATYLPRDDGKWNNII
jgi:hypothetical protein